MGKRSLEKQVHWCKVTLSLREHIRRLKTSSAWFHVLYFSPGWMSNTMTKCFSSLLWLTKGSLIPEETLNQRRLLLLPQILETAKSGENTSIRNTYSANPHMVSLSHMNIPSDFKSLFTNLRWGCPQLMWQDVTSGIDEDVGSLTLRGLKFVQVYSGLKCVLPVILEKKLCIQSSKHIRNLGHNFLKSQTWFNAWNGIKWMLF